MRKLGQAEIQDLEASVGGQAQVGRFQIAMDDAPRVGRRQALRQLQAQADYFLRGQRSRGQLLVKRFSGNVFRDQKVGLAVGVKVVNGGDVRVVELGQGEGFLAKTLAGSLVRQGAGRQDFYGNVAFQLLIMGKKDHSHPARADLLHDAVVAEILPEHVPEHTGMLSPTGMRVKCEGSTSRRGQMSLICPWSSQLSARLRVAPPGR